MQRARRLASTAVVAVLAVSGLSACRTDPGVAAYVGSSTISEQTVQEIFADAQAKVDAQLDQARAAQRANPDPAQQPVPDEVKLGLTRANVVQTLVGVRVFKSIAEQRKVQPTAVQPAQVAEQFGLPPGARYVEAFAEYQGYLNALLDSARSATLTDAEQREVFRRFSSVNGPGDAMTYEQFQNELLTPENRQVLERTYGLRQDLRAATDKADIRVNPRYGVQELPLLPVPTREGGQLSLVGLPVSGDSAPVVTDLS
ncbi:MAG TPA: hypothetical protein VFO77_00570 [Actinoplanes sp.]|nr:hypothetical protein [Actinoplanes sp.]